MPNRFESLSIPSDVESKITENILIIKKWNWDYSEALVFQKSAQEFIQKNRDLKIYIFCNHPHCFTLGRGNERGQDELVDFDEQIESLMSFDLHRIHRGGGVTFHYPGQWIFYPIIALKESLSLEDLSCWLLKSVKQVLSESFGIQDVITATKLMGVWRKKLKLASIGIGVSRFVTEHGLALNLDYDKKMFDELLKINPCGMSPQTYISADKCLEESQIKPENFIEQFQLEFEKTILNL